MLLCIPFFPTSLLLQVLAWSHFLFYILLFLEFYSELYILLFSSTLISSLLLLLLILYLILLLLSSYSHRRCFGDFTLFVLVLFVWPIYPCYYLWYCSMASMSYSLSSALLAILLSQLLVQYKLLLLVEWISFLRLYLEFSLNVECLLLTIFPGFHPMQESWH